MKFLFDTADTAALSEYLPIYPCGGVTTNPSIIKAAAPADLFAHLRAIRGMIGSEAELHAQVSSSCAEGMLDDAAALLEHIDAGIFIKVPVTREGLKVMKTLKANGVKVTATAVYSKVQGFLAAAAGADRIAPYYNRMENMEIDPKEVISGIAAFIANGGYDSEIIAASFRNLSQVCDAFAAGADSVTLPPAMLDGASEAPGVRKAVSDFRADWDTLYAGRDISAL